MSRAPKNALKKFASRHHLHFQTDRLHDEILPAGSVFRHNRIKDEAVAIGSVDEIDIYMAQRSAVLKTPDKDKRHLSFTIVASGLQSDHQALLYVSNSVPAAYALNIKHLHTSWKHHHVHGGALLMPPHQGTIPTAVEAALQVAGNLSLEIQDQMLIGAAFPAVDSDNNLEDMIISFKKVWAYLR